MGAALPVLNNVRVASPCGQSWDEMEGDDRSRFCGHCKLRVYNLSGMMRPEAEALVRDSEGRLCVRFYRRRDGSVLTADCPVGRRRARRALMWHCATVAAMFAAFPALAGLMHATKWREWPVWHLRAVEPYAVRWGIIDYPVVFGRMG